MIPIKLQLSNFMSYKNPQTLDFTSFNVGCLTGENGAGKSTILEAVTWALWGKARGEKLTDELIHQGQNSMWVEFIFETEGKTFRVLRKRERKGKLGKTTLYFGIAKKGLDFWQNLTEQEIAQTQRKIENTLHLPYEIFENSAYLRQGHADEFTIKTPTERKQILSDILGLDLFEKLEEKAKEHLKQIEEQQQDFSYQINSFKQQMLEKEDLKKNFSQILREKNIVEQNLKNLEEKLKAIQKDKNLLQIFNEKLILARENFEKINSNLEDSQNEKKQVEEEILKLRLILKNKNKILADFKSFEKIAKEEQEMQEKFEKSFPIKEQLIKIKAFKERLKEETTKISKISVCPTCKRPLPKKDCQKIICHLEKEFKEKWQGKIPTLQNKLRQIGYDEKIHQNLKQQLKVKEEISVKLQDLDIAENNLSHFKKRLAQLQKVILQNLKEREEIIKNGKDLKAKIETLKQKVGNFEQLETKIMLLRENLNIIATQTGQMKEKLRQIEICEGKISNLEKEISKLSNQKSTFENLAFLFSKKGVPTMIIEQTLPALEEEANLILQKVSSDKMKVTFQMQRPKKTNEEMIETLDIMIFDPLGSRPYELFSGGEAFRINFAIRVALSKLLAKKAQAKVRFLVVDEGFGNLDTAGKDDIISAINSVKADFDKILVITHLEELKNAFQNQIQVVKEEDGSKIKIVQ